MGYSSRTLDETDEQLYSRTGIVFRQGKKNARAGIDAKRAPSDKEKKAENGEDPTASEKDKHVLERASEREREGESDE